MDILYLLIPMSAVLVLVILAVFAWATYSGQFDDVEDEGRRILAAGDESIDNRQAVSRDAAKESLHRPTTRV